MVGYEYVAVMESGCLIEVEMLIGHYITKGLRARYHLRGLEKICGFVLTSGTRVEPPYSGCPWAMM